MRYPTLDATLAKRSAAATAAGHEAARAVLDGLRRAGAVVKLVGSAARGRMRPGSDIDVLVLDRGGMAPIELVARAERAAAGWTVDVIFAEHTDPVALELFLTEAIDEPGLPGR